MRKKSRDEEKISISKSICLLVCAFIYVIPVIMVFVNAFKPLKEIQGNFWALPKNFMLENFQTAFGLMDFWRAGVNTVIITLGTVFTGVLVSYLAAYGISHLKGKLSSGLYLMFVMGQIVPMHTVIVAIAIIASKFHINNTYFGLIILYVGFHCAFGIMTYVGFLKGIPAELEEAAVIDGCGLGRTIFQIVFPLLKPCTITVGTLFFLWTWSDYLLPSILISNAAKRTLILNLYIFKSVSNIQWNYFIAGLSLCILPVIIIYILAQKYITSGLVAGAVKG